MEGDITGERRIREANKHGNVGVGEREAERERERERERTQRPPNPLLPTVLPS